MFEGMIDLESTHNELLLFSIEDFVSKFDHAHSFPVDLVIFTEGILNGNLLFFFFLLVS